MKENNHKTSTSVNWRQMPLMRALVFVQMSIAVIFSIISMLIASYFISERSISIQNTRKIDLIRIMSPNQEKIRLWSSLGMTEALELVLKDIRKIDYVKTLNISRLTEAQFDTLKQDRHVLVIPETVDLNLPYYLVFRLEAATNSSIASALAIPVVIFIFILTLIYSSIAFIMKKIFKPLSLLISDDLSVTNQIIDFEASGEMGVLISRIQKSQQAKIQFELEKMNFKLATQFAHDIRSPLEVLKGLKDDMSHFPESTRKRIHLSINRIEEITFNLLNTHKESVGIFPYKMSEDLLSLLCGSVMEKRIEFRSYENLDIIDNFNSDCFGLFSIINRVMLKNIISNLVNNGIEAFNGGSGVIEISLIDDFNKCLIKIYDNGPGISDDLGKKLFTKGFTTKKSGNGLGLYNAKHDIEAMGGTLTFTSEMGKGTTFTITLPKSEAPPTFLEAIHTNLYEKIVILDDDPAFHEVWSKRLEDVNSKIEHIYSVQEMLSKYNSLEPKILLLSDFELMDRDHDGIDTILKFNHAANSVLVTARSEEQSIQERCLKYGIKLLPKSLVNYVPLITGKSYGLELLSPQTSIILIDDDKLVRLNWANYCKSKALLFHSFHSIEDFLKVSANFNKDLRIYIDSHLGDGIQGEFESEQIFNLGFENLFLTTGYQKEDIIKPSWIKEIYSKSPDCLSEYYA